MATPNVLEYSELFMAALDLQMLQESTTMWMEANASQVRYNGGNKVKIPRTTMNGLADYSRSAGFVSGAVTLVWDEYEFEMDRGREFNLDSQDYDETNFVEGAGMIMSEFQRTEVVPEVDAYRYSKIFALANAALQTGSYTPATGTVYKALTDDILAIQSVIGEREPLGIAISYTAANTLDNADGIEKHISLETFSNGVINTKTKAIDGIPLFRVPAAVFQSAYTFSATDGFAPTALAMDLNWVIAARRAIIAIVKTERIRIFDPSVNQDMDAWKIQYRKYHSLWIPTNKLTSVYVSYTPIAAPALTATVAAGSVAGATSFTATAGTGNVLAYKVAASAVTANYNDIPTGLTNPYTSGADITGVTAGQFLAMYELDSLGHVVKFLCAELASGDIHA